MSDPGQDISEVVFDADVIAGRVQQLARAIENGYRRRLTDPDWYLVVISVLRGGIYFLTDLTRALTLPQTIDLMAVSRYGEASSSGVVRLLKDLDDDIEKRDVLVVEDVIDTGLTLGYLIANLRARRPRSLSVCTLLDRPNLRIVDDLPVNYVGFEIDERFLVGYGLDYRQRYRHLPYLGVLGDDVLRQLQP
ncbi:MAG: hypoxanthine phosphoribosyltransferase [Thermaerobacterales bacterium]